MRSLEDALNAYHALTPRNPSCTGSYDQPRVITGTKRASDPNWPLDLRADLDRWIDGLPGMARDLFHLRYRTGMQLSEVARRFRVGMDEAIGVHNRHIKRAVEAGIFAAYFRRQNAA